MPDSDEDHFLKELFANNRSWAKQIEKDNPASVHLDRPRAGALALALLTATTTIAYWSLSVVDDPDRHLDKLDPMSWLG